MPTIAQVTNPSFKSGVSPKNNKPWTLMQIKTSDGKDATIFAPAREGDEVELEFNADYNNYTAKLVKPTAGGGQLKEINEKLDEALKMLRTLTGTQTTPVITRELNDDQPPVDQMEPPF